MTMVQVNGERGDSAPLRQGLSQDAVLSPLLFLLYINDLRTVVPETVKAALFTDDVSLVSSHHNKLITEKEQQRAVIVVAEWSTSKKMVLNADKCEVKFFSTNSHEANWQPTIIANNIRIHRSPQPKFLGVTLDRLLTFGPHIQSISINADARCRVIASLTSKKWGWRKDQSMKVYKALQLSLLTYAAPAWQPRAAPSRIEQLERCQNKALRVVAGQLISNPVETLQREAGICSIATAAKRATALSYEKAHRLPQDHPRRQILAEKPLKKLAHRHT